MIVVDSSVLIAAVAVGESASERATILLAEPDVAVSELVIAEIFVRVFRDRDHLARLRYESILGTLRLLPITQSVLYRAAELRALHGLKTPDAIHAATALLHPDATFATSDRAFAKVPGLTVELV